MRRAKIVATLGPATSSYDDIMSVMEAGANIFRMNLSHGAKEVHEEIYGNVRRAAADADKPIGVLVDLQGGPKFVSENSLRASRTQAPVTRSRSPPAMSKERRTSWGRPTKGLPGDVKAGRPLLIDDGKVRLEAESPRLRMLSHGSSWGPGVQQQGDQPSWRCCVCPGTLRQGRRGLALGFGSGV